MSEQFRHRIGEEGVELILKESIRINLAMENKKKEEDEVNLFGLCRVATEEDEIKEEDLSS